MAIEDNRSITTNMEEIFLLQSIDGGGAGGGGGGFNGSYLTIGAAINQQYGIPSISVGESSFASGINGFAYGYNNVAGNQNSFSLGINNTNLQYGSYMIGALNFSEPGGTSQSNGDYGFNEYNLYLGTANISDVNIINVNTHLPARKIIFSNGTQGIITKKFYNSVELDAALEGGELSEGDILIAPKSENSISGYSYTNHQIYVYKIVIPKTYSSETPYEFDDVVSYNNNYYICKTGVLSWSENDWNASNQSSSFGYSSGDLVKKNNDIYMCINNVAPNSKWSFYNWRLIWRKVELYQKDEETGKGYVCAGKYGAWIQYTGNMENFTNYNFTQYITDEDPTIYLSIQNFYQGDVNNYLYAGFLYGNSLEQVRVVEDYLPHDNVINRNSLDINLSNLALNSYVAAYEDYLPCQRSQDYAVYKKINPYYNPQKIADDYTKLRFKTVYGYKENDSFYSELNFSDGTKINYEIGVVQVDLFQIGNTTQQNTLENQKQGVYFQYNYNGENTLIPWNDLGNYGLTIASTVGIPFRNTLIGTANSLTRTSGWVNDNIIIGKDNALNNKGSIQENYIIGIDNNCSTQGTGNSNENLKNNFIFGKSNKIMSGSKSETNQNYLIGESITLKATDYLLGDRINIKSGSFLNNTFFGRNLTIELENSSTNCQYNYLFGDEIRIATLNSGELHKFTNNFIIGKNITIIAKHFSSQTETDLLTIFGQKININSTYAVQNDQNKLNQSLIVGDSICITNTKEITVNNIVGHHIGIGKQDNSSDGKSIGDKTSPIIPKLTKTQVFGSYITLYGLNSESQFIGSDMSNTGLKNTLMGNGIYNFGDKNIILGQGIKNNTYNNTESVTSVLKYNYSQNYSPGVKVTYSSDDEDGGYYLYECIADAPAGAWDSSKWKKIGDSINGLGTETGGYGNILFGKGINNYGNDNIVVGGSEHTINGSSNVILGAASYYNSSYHGATINSNYNFITAPNTTLSNETGFNNIIGGYDGNIPACFNSISNSNGFNTIIGNSVNISNTGGSNYVFSSFRGATISGGKGYNYILGGEISIIDTDQSTVLGFGHYLNNGNACFIGGAGNNSFGGSGHAILNTGNSVYANTSNAFIIGGGNVVGIGGNLYTEGGGNVLVDGGQCSHIEGGGNTGINIQQSHIEGGGNRMYGTLNSHLEGGGNYVYNGTQNHVEGGGNCIGFAQDAHVEGKYNYCGIRYLKRNVSSPSDEEYVKSYDNTATYEVGDYVTVPGETVTLSGNPDYTPSYTPLILYKCITAVTEPEEFDETKWTTSGSVLGCHAEGYATVSSGQGSHSEGYRTFAVGQASHASGSYNYAIGDSTFVAGYGNKAAENAPHQAVFGRYNDYTNTSALFVIGCGSNDSNRNNAFTVDDDGNAILNGKLTIGTAPTANMDVTTKQYVDNIRDVNEDLIANTYSNSSTYVVGAYAIYEHTLYVCTTPVTVAEDFDDTKWTVVKLADRVNTAEGNIATLETTVGDSASGLVHDVSDLSNRVSTLEGLTYSLSRPEINRAATIQDQTNFEIDADYTNEPIDVYVNGIRKKKTDYTVVQGTNMKEVQLNTGLSIGDEVDITYIKLTVS